MYKWIQEVILCGLIVFNAENAQKLALLVYASLPPPLFLLFDVHLLFFSLLLLLLLLFLNYYFIYFFAD
jgi:hypothetical protein